jgi:F-type H+-transporting ATPase subunit epsilon
MTEAILVNPRQFQFELVAPEKVEISALEERIILPGEEGDFMVLAGHELRLAGLRPGVISVFHANNHVVRYFITGGFADIGNTHCTVLTPHITPVSKIVADRVASDIERMSAALNTETDEAAQARIKAEVKVLEEKLEAAQKYNA